MAIKRCTKLELYWESCPFVFQGHLSNFKVTRLKQIVDFYTKGVFGQELQFEFTSSYEMMHKAWSSIEKVPFFQGHQSNFKVTRDRKSPISTSIGRFRSVTPVWIHRWLWNDAQCLMWYRRVLLLFFKVIHQISRSRGQQNAKFDPNWACPDRHSNLNSLK